MDAGGDSNPIRKSAQDGDRIILSSILIAANIPSIYLVSIDSQTNTLLCRCRNLENSSDNWFSLALSLSCYNFSARRPAAAAPRSESETVSCPRRGTPTGRTSTAVPGTRGRCGPATRRAVPPGPSGRPGPSAPRPAVAAGGSGRGEAQSRVLGLSLYGVFQPNCYFYLRLFIIVQGKIVGALRRVVFFTFSASVAWSTWGWLWGRDGSD